MIPADLILETKKVLLRPVEETDRDAFFSLAKNDEEMWEYFSLNLGDENQLRAWMELAIVEKKSGLRRPFAIIDKITGSVAGSSSMGNISFFDLRLEIGWSWLGKPYRGSGINRHAKYLMMRYAFESLLFERVEFKTDLLNARARKGLQNIGGVEEGILRSHMKMWNNRRRTSIYYSVLKDEWPVVKKNLFSDIEE